MSYNLQDVLTHLDQNDMSTEHLFGDDHEALEKFHKDVSWMIPQWITTSKNDAEHRVQLLMFDEMCNSGWGRFYYHPKLQAKLLAAIGPGHKVRHTFYRPTGGRVPGMNDLFDLLLAEFEDIRPDEVVLWAENADIEELEDLLYSHGIPIEDHKGIKAQYEKVKS